MKKETERKTKETERKKERDREKVRKRQTDQQILNNSRKTQHLNWRKSSSNLK